MGKVREVFLALIVATCAAIAAGCDCGDACGPTPTPPQRFTANATASSTKSATVSCPNGGTQSASATVTGISGTGEGATQEEAQRNAQLNAQNNADALALGNAQRDATAKCTNVPPPTACTIASISQQSFGSAGGTGTVTINNPSGVAWSATASDAWITFTNSTGNGTTLNFRVDNSGSSRAGSISVCGQSRSISQEIVVAACTLTVTTVPRIPSQGGSVSGQVTSNQAWSLTSSASWVNATPTSGSGGTTDITFSGQPNVAGSGERSFNANITGCGGNTTRTIAVVQDAVVVQPCEYAMTFPVNGYTYDYRGGNTEVGVGTNRTDCTWSVTSSASWLATSPNNSAGTGKFTITAGGNTGGQRTATVTFTTPTGITRSTTVTQGPRP